jgi:hypothetical protein
MTSHPLFPRIGPFTWLFLQAASVVGSILLAFAIDAWWEQRTEAAEKNALLVSLKTELLDSRRALIDDRIYREATRESVKSLLAAVAAGRYEDTDKTLDHRLSDLLWYSSALAMPGALESLLAGGQLAAVEDQTLRNMLATVPDSVAWFSTLSEQGRATFAEVLVPFLARHTSLAQISNEGAVHGRAGDGWGADPELAVPRGRTTDHSSLLANREFEGILIRKLWNESDVLYRMDDYVEGINELVKLIDQELANTT